MSARQQSDVKGLATPPPLFISAKVRASEVIMMFNLALVILAAITVGNAQAVNPPVPQEPLKVNLCELLEHSDRYDSKVVVVTAIMVSNFEYSSFRDESCKAMSSGYHDGALATFDRALYDVDTPLDQKLWAILKDKSGKIRTGQARVTIVARFIDSMRVPVTDGTIVIASSCCRYKLEVRRLLAVERVTPMTNRK